MCVEGHMRSTLSVTVVLTSVILDEVHDSPERLTGADAVSSLCQCPDLIMFDAQACRCPVVHEDGQDEGGVV